MHHGAQGLRGAPVGKYWCRVLCLVCLRLYKEEGSSPVSLQLPRGGI